MNPILVILIIAFAVFLWFILSGIFRGLGAVANRIIDDTKDVIFENDEEENENEKED